MQMLTALLNACSLEDAKYLVFANSASDQEQLMENGPDVVTMIRESLARGLSACDGVGWIQSLSSSGAPDTYKQASLSRILRAMTGNVSTPRLSHGEPTTAPDSRSGSLFDLTLRKLRAFLTLKYDEQVAVTGLVEKCVTVLAALVVQSGYGPQLSQYASKVILVSNCVCDLLEQLTGHLDRISDCGDKIIMVRTVLNQPQNTDPRLRKMLDSENQQTLRILETGVLLRELFCEVEGGLLAMDQLRNIVHIEEADEGDTDSPERERYEHSRDSIDSFSDDDDDDADYDDDREFHMQDIGTLEELSNLVNEDSFLLACAGLEKSLDGILCESDDFTPVIRENTY